MAPDTLHQLFESVADTRDLVLPPFAGEQQWADELFAIWSAARAEANDALDAWRAVGGGEAYAVYRAAEDRCDAAEEALALFAHRRAGRCAA